MTIFRCSTLPYLIPILFLVSCGTKERTVEEEIAEMRAEWDREDLAVFAPPSNEGEAYDVPSDPGAAYRMLRWKRLQGKNFEVLTRRDGSSGTSFTRMLVDCDVRRYRVIGEGNEEEKALKDLSYESAWTDLVPGSIKDVTVALTCKKAGS